MWIMIVPIADITTGTPRVTQFTVDSCEDDFTDVDVHFHGSFSA